MLEDKIVEGVQEKMHEAWDIDRKISLILLGMCLLSGIMGVYGKIAYEFYVVQFLWHSTGVLVISKLCRDVYLGRNSVCYLPHFTPNEVRYSQLLVPYRYKMREHLGLNKKDKIVFKDEKCSIYRVGQDRFKEIAHVSFWLKKANGEYVLLSIDDFDWDEDYLNDGTYIRMKNKLFDKEYQWHEYIVKFLRKDLGDVVYKCWSNMGLELIEDHLKFFERNRDKLSLFDYEYYYFNQVKGNQINVKSMMNCIDNVQISS